METFNKVFRISTLTIMFLTLSSFVCSEENHPPWHRKVLERSTKKAPLLGMDGKDRVLNDFFVLIDKKTISENSRDECVQKLVEYLKTKITKNTDYYDVKRVYAFGDLVILRVKLPERLVSILQEHTYVKLVEANTR